MGGGTGTTNKEKKNWFNQIFKIMAGFSLLYYVFAAINLKELKPWKWGEVNRKMIEQEQYKNNINASYNKFLDNYLSPTSTKQDTFNFYSEKGLGHRIKFEEPSFEEKERAVLEGKVE